MNSRPKDPKTARNKNVLVIGGSGSGKTRFWLKPNLMQMHSSYVVTDPKGTILVECGKMLQRGAPKLGKDGKPMKDKHGKVIYEPYRIKVLNTINFKKSMHYKLSDSRYATLDAQYEKEQSELTAEISVLEKAVKSYEKHEKDADRFIALIDKYENFDKLTIAMLNEFIEKILVHERDRKGSIQTTQEVEIYFNFVGRFVPPAFGEAELTPEELEEIRKREERKDRLHQNYLKRKANGKQKEYEERTKAKKKAEIEARKQAIRTEDIARGVFIPVSSLPQLGPRKGA